MELQRESTYKTFIMDIFYNTLFFSAKKNKVLKKRKN